MSPGVDLTAPFLKPLLIISIRQPASGRTGCEVRTFYLGTGFLQSIKKKKSFPVAVGQKTFQHKVVFVWIREATEIAART